MCLYTQVSPVQGDRPRDREAVCGGGRRRRVPEGGRGQGRGRRRRQRHLRHAHLHPLQGGEKGGNMSAITKSQI